MKPFIPVLFSDISQLKSPVDIMKYCLHQYVSLPKNINDTFADSELSLVWDDAESGHDPELLKDAVRQRLTSTLRGYFPDASSVDVTVTTSQLDNARYDMTIDMLVVISGTPHSLSQDFSTDANGKLAFKMTGN